MKLNEERGFFENKLFCFEKETAMGKIIQGRI
jgi:hypothetical protein